MNSLPERRAGNFRRLADPQFQSIHAKRKKATHLEAA
jgi:hypothetical protein